MQNFISSGAQEQQFWTDTMDCPQLQKLWLHCWHTVAWSLQVCGIFQFRPSWIITNLQCLYWCTYNIRVSYWCLLQHLWDFSCSSAWCLEHNSAYLPMSLIYSYTLYSIIACWQDGLYISLQVCCTFKAWITEVPLLCHHYHIVLNFRAGWNVMTHGFSIESLIHTKCKFHSL